MSYVSSYCILAGIAEEDEEVLAAINAFDGLRGAQFRDLSDHAGGNKALQATIYAGAFNHLDEGAFAEHLRTAVPWREPSSVRVFLNSEHDEGWSEVDVSVAPLDLEPRIGWKGGA